LSDLILVLDDQEGVRQLLAQSLDGEDREIRCEAVPDDLRSYLSSVNPSLLIIDPAGLTESPGELLSGIREMGLDLPVILLSSVADVGLAVEAMRAGAHDFLGKPIPLPRLLDSVSEALFGSEAEQKLLERRRLFRIGDGQSFYKSTSEAMTQVYDDALMVAMSGDTTTLITGESGTGKEVIAQLIHELSPRHESAFLELNCAAIPAELLESELFGHEAGAFTDAKESKAGLFEVANQGTIFLDEIGEMSMNLQVKLLRFLERKTFRRVGGTKDIEVDVRIISATNRSLREMVAERSFREDLFYRLNVVPINLPPLRERREDILPLIAHFFGEFNSRFNKNFSRIDDEARRMLMDYPWPGNIRELRNVVERVLLMEQGPELASDQLRSHLSGDWEQVAETFARRLARMIEEPIPEEGVDLVELLRAVERKFIDKAYHQSAENQSKAAEMLKLGRDKLRYRMKQIGATIEDDVEREESSR
jgi:two-component system, NtrC family, response regulator AtoC